MEIGDVPKQKRKVCCLLQRKRHSRPEKGLLGGEMVEGGTLVDKKRLRPAQPSQKVVAERWRRTAVSEKPKQEKRLWRSYHEDRLRCGGRQPHHHDDSCYSCICHHLSAFPLKHYLHF